MKSTYILYFLALYFLFNSQCICWKSGLNGAQYKSVKWGVGVESAHLHGIVNGESLWNVFCCPLCIFYCQTTPILKTLGQFENLVFVIMSTRENIRLIAWSSFIIIRFFINMHHPHKWAPLAGNWLAARTDLTPYLQVLLSWRSTVVRFHFGLKKNIFILISEILVKYWMNITCHQINERSLFHLLSNITFIELL